MKKISKLNLVLLFILAALPILSFAAFTDTRELISEALDLVKLLGAVAAAAALLFFFWGLAKLIFYAGDETKRGEGKKVMFWGIIALFVLFSIWGIVDYIGRQIEVPLDSPVELPALLCPPGTANC